MSELKKYTLSTVDSEGNIIEESTLEVKEGSILIQYMPVNTSLQIAHQAHKIMTRALDNGASVITMMHGATLQVLNVNEK